MTIAIFEISTLEFTWVHSFAKKQKQKQNKTKQKCLNMGPKSPYLGIFGSDVI